MSDLHLAPPGQVLAGFDPMRQMRHVLTRIEQLDVAPAFIVVSGDLTDNGSADSYQVVNEVLKELRAGKTSVLLALGNHDDRATFRRVVLGEERFDQDPYHYSQLIEGLRVIVLDSTIPGDVRGALGAEQLAWLEAQLRDPAPRGALIVLHHPCRLAAPARHYPMFIVREAADIASIVSRRWDRVVGVLAGHSHQANSAPFGGTLHVTAPAVSASSISSRGAIHPDPGFWLPSLPNCPRSADRPSRAAAVRGRDADGGAGGRGAISLSFSSSRLSKATPLFPP